MTKKAMVDLHREGIVPLVQVHDELNFSGGDFAQILKIKEIMENAVALSVPIVADLEMGPSWGETVKYEQCGDKFLEVSS